MPRTRLVATFLVTGSALALPCAAAPAAPAAPPARTAEPAPAPDPCKSEVARFEQAIGFIRANQGQQAAADLKERLLPAKLEADILQREGYCGLAKYLKDKKLAR